MADRNRNNSPGILLLFLVIVFFSVFQSVQEKHFKGSLAVLSVSSGNRFDVQAIIGPTASTPETVFYRINTVSAKYTCTPCACGREFIFNKLISSYCCACQHKFLFNKPVVSSFSLQKVPEQGKEDDLLPLS